MRIGMDARFLSHPQQGGFKTYVQGLVGGLASVDEDNEYFLYTDREVDPAATGRVPQGAQIVTAEADVPGPGLVLREQWKLRRLAARDQLDLFHFPTNTASLRFPCPFVLTLHDTIELEGNPWEGKRPFLEGIRRRAMTAYGRFTSAGAARKARKVITVSRHVKERASSFLDLSQDRFVPIHSGPGSPPLILSEPERQQRLSQYDLSPGYILALTGVDRRKNATSVLQAYLQLDPSLQEDCPLVFVAPRRSQVRSWLNLPSKIKVAEGPDEESMAALFQEARLFVFPSFDEGFGFPPLEAMAYGTPVIASQIPSHQEILADAPLWIDPNDPETIRQAIYRALTEKDLIETMRLRGNMAHRELSWENTARSVLRVYEEAVMTEPPS